MPNKWVEHVEKIAKDNNISYGCAVSDPKCKNSYKTTNDQKTENKKHEKKPHTMYDKPIGPVK